MRKLMKYISIFLVITNVMLSLNIYSIKAMTEDELKSKVESIIVSEDNTLSVTMIDDEKLGEVEYALVENDMETPVFQKEASFNVEKDKNYILYVKIENNEAVKFNVDTIAPTYEYFNVSYLLDDYVENKTDKEVAGSYKSATINFKVSKDASSYQIVDLKKPTETIVDKKIENNSSEDLINISEKIKKNSEYEVKIFDEFENKISFQFEVLGVDENIPVLKTKIIAKDGVVCDDIEWSKSVEIEILPKDDKYRYSLVSEKDAPSFGENNVFEKYENGTYVYKIRNEKTGVESQEQKLTIKSIDKTGPEFIFFEENNRPYIYDDKKNELTITASDNGCGVAKFSLSYTDDFGNIETIEIDDKNITENNGKFIGKIRNIPRKEYKLTATDHLGNCTEYNDVVDNVCPVINATTIDYQDGAENKDGIMYGKSANVIVTATDNKSNKLLYTYALDPQNAVFNADNISNVIENLKENQIYYILVRDEDGNVSEFKSDGKKDPAVVEITNIDRNGPIIENIKKENLYAEDSEFSNENGFKITVSAIDEGIGLGEAFAIYKKGETPIFSGPNSEDEGGRCTYEKIVKENGTYIVKVKDILGNETESEPIVIDNIDTVAPTVGKAELTVTGEKNINSTKFGTYVNSDITVTIPIEDKSKENNSGIKDDNEDAPTLKLTKVGEKEAFANITGVKEKGTDNYIFKIPYKDYKYSTFNMSLHVSDKVGNVNDIDLLPYWHDDKEYRLPILIDQDTPKVSIGINEDDEKTKLKKYDDKEWIVDDVSIVYSISDIFKNKDCSGINNYKIEIYNGTKFEVYEEYSYLDKKIESKTGSLKTSDLASKYYRKNNGVLDIRITVKDNAGNTESAELTLYCDFKAPEITDVTIQGTTKDSVVALFEPTKSFISKGPIDIIVEFDDVGDNSYASAGVNIDETLLTVKYSNDVEEFIEPEPVEVKDSENDKVKYKFTVDTTDLYFDVYVKTADNVGNVNASDRLGQKIIEANKEEFANVILDSISPKVSEIKCSGVANIKGKEYITKNEDIEFNISDIVKDRDCSGLASINVTVNGQEFINEKFETEKVEERTIKFNTEEIIKFVGENGKLHLEVNAKDNAGNPEDSDDSAAVMAERVIYCDFKAPEITNVTITGDADCKLSTFKATNSFVANDSVKINITLNDTYINNASTGINNEATVLNLVDQNDKLYAINHTEVIANDDNTYTYIFELNSDDLKNKYFDVYLQTEDFAKHKIAPEGEHGKKIVSANNGIGFENIIIDDNNPAIEAIDFIKENESTIMIDQKEWINHNAQMKISVSDILEDKDCSGLASIKVTVNNEEINALARDLTNEKYENTTIEFNTDILPNDNRGMIHIVVIVKDNAGNESTKERVLYRDLDQPILDVSYDNNTPDSTFKDFYKENRTLTLSVKEINFNAGLINVIMKKDNTPIKTNLSWQLISGEAGTNDAVYQTKLLISEDGDYEIYVDGYDMMNFKVDKPFADKFVLDKTKPTINITYNNNNVKNENYYNQARIATITIAEHNFDSSRIKVTGNATDNGASKAFPVTSSWQRSGDNNIATIKYDSDALYTFDIDYTDKAGNQMNDYNLETFYVDTTVPELQITGVEANSANSGEVKPVVLASDTNYDPNELSIKLTGDHRGELELAGEKSLQANGEVFTFNDMKREKDNDDVYMINAGLNDKAGNRTEANIVYSLNRFGSTYIFSSSLTRMLEAQYIKKGQAVIFDELNVNQLVEVAVKLSVNGQVKELKKDIDYTLSEAREKAWYKYTYNLKSSLFEKDGIYRIITTSKDAAGNINENVIGDKEATINFTIDKTAPTIAVRNLKSNGIYNDNVKDVKISVEDNLMLDNIEVLLNGNKTDVVKNEDAVTVSIPEKGEVQNLKITAIDKAGNKTERTIENFTVSSNAFVRWYVNKPLFFGSLAVVFMVSAFGIYIFTKKKNTTTSEEKQ